MANPSPLFGGLPLLEAYQHYLLHTAGLSQGTSRFYCRSVVRFLDELGIMENAPSALMAVTSLQIQDYFFHLLEKRPLSAGCDTSALRSFFRYLQFRGFVFKDHQRAFPPFRRKSAPIKGCLSATQLSHLLKAKHYKGKQGLRDRAIVLLASRLGLRAGEIARVTLEDINWRESTLRLRKTKGNRERLMPMTPDVGKALVTYLCSPQLRGEVREVFLSSRVGHCLQASSVCSVAKKAFQKAGLNVPCAGTHLLRHTLATHLVQKGTDLKAVADLLGHRQLSTTTIYTKVNLPMLSQMVTPWPEEVA